MEILSDFAIEVDSVSKIYYPDIKLKENLSDSIKNLFKKNSKIIEVKALDDVSFKLRKGEVIGIIGDNGSGKSTLLKILSGITEPTSGSVKVNGKLVSILEVGTGFHPELSGRENIYFTAEIYGMSAEEIEGKESSIANFSELGDFLDIPVKQYSSGMFMRLAFSIIAHLEADIILLDEVFSVGDIGFRKKCENKIDQLNAENKSIVFVNHDLTSVTKIASKYILLEKGTVKEYGSDINTVFNYIDSTYNENTRLIKKSNDITDNSFRLEHFKLQEYYISTIDSFKNNFIAEPISIKCYSAENGSDLNALSAIIIELEYYQKNDALIFPSFDLSYQFQSRIGALCPNYSELAFENIFSKKGHKKLACTIPSLFFNNGLFLFSLLFTDEKSNCILKYSNILRISINYTNEMMYKFKYDGKYPGAFMPSLKWTYL